MRLSERTLAALTEVILNVPYRSGPQLIQFFAAYGPRDLYGSDFGARFIYAQKKLREFNGATAMREILLDAFNQFHLDELDIEGAASAFNKTLMRDGFALTIEHEPGFMNGDLYIEGPPKFRILDRGSAIPKPEGLSSLEHEAVSEQISKCRGRIASGDHAGAIASTYTLMEESLKLILKEADVPFSASQGDIRELYRVLRTEMGIDPSNQAIDPTLKPILDGLQKIVSGLYEISNRASDRHARIYNPAKRHAKLAVNAAFTLCEFLLDIRDSKSN